MMELATRRLLLRPLHDHDAPAMAHALNNFEVSKYLSRVPFPYTLDDARNFITLQRGFDPATRIRAIAFRAAPDELLGVISYEQRADGDGFEFGYWLSESCWGMRIMTEAAQTMLAHAFLADGIAVLKSGFWNPISGRLLGKLGFVETHRTMTFSLAQNSEVAAVKLELRREVWIAQSKGRAE